MTMGSFLFNFFFIAISVFMTCAKVESTFDQYYEPLWGLNHLTVRNQGNEVQLLLDRSSGAGFRSKSSYCYGSFQISMKISKKRSAGVITSFYLTSSWDNSQGNHDEFDFEFVGTNGIFQTNVFANDNSHREERIQLWFNPSQAFHTYTIVWNQKQVVFYVDKRPVRVFKNHQQGVNLSSQPMHVEASIWNGSWAGEVDWSKAPFIAQYQGFAIDHAHKTSNNTVHCQKISETNESIELSPDQQRQYEGIRRKYLRWDYCSDKSRYHPECGN